MPLRAGYKIAPSAVWQILKDTGIDPASARSAQTWWTCLEARRRLTDLAEPVG
jgi:hypothetical protein